ncbi:MAG: M10 family metallopeptidase C-terminal domain-containing protein [Pseudomonadota bacterium]
MSFVLAQESQNERGADEDSHQHGPGTHHHGTCDHEGECDCHLHEAQPVIEEPSQCGCDGPCDCEANQTYQTFDEDGEVQSNTSTSAAIGGGDVFNGAIDFAGDTDWIRIVVPADTAVDIVMSATGAGTVSDPFIRLYDANGTFIKNESSYTADSSTLQFNNTSSVAQTYYVSAEDYGNDDTGSYSVAATFSQAPEVATFTVSEVVAQLTEDFWVWSGQSSSPTTYSWNVSPGDSIDVDISALDAGGQAFALASMSAWNMVTGINFNVTSLSNGAFGMVFDDAVAGSAYASYSSSGGNITSASINIGADWIQNDWASDGSGGATIDYSSYSLQTYIHEIGHAMGLGHGGNYNGSARYGVDNNYTNDSWQMSVMSYFSQSENTSIDASFAYVMTPMIGDIAAMQALYGVDGAIRATNTTYGDGSTAGSYYDDMFTENTATFTIIDDGGIDLLDLSNVDADNRIDLNPGTISDYRGLRGNLSIYSDTIIENAILGGGDDTLTGNSADNILVGGGGMDTLNGGDGADILYGGGQDDSLTGGAENDVFVFSTNRGAIQDYEFSGVNSQSGAVSGDLIYLEGQETYYLAEINGMVQIDDLAIQAVAATGNVAVVAALTTNLTSAWDLGAPSFDEFSLAGRTVNVYDTGTAESFAQSSYSYDANALLTVYSTLNDDNSSLTVDLDSDNTRTWERISSYKDDQGQEFDYRIDYDNGTQIRTVSDVDAVNVWGTILEYRDAGGVLYDKRTNYDDGTQLRAIFDDENTAIWDTILEYRDAGSNFYEKRTNYDDDTQLRVIFDFDESEDWDTIFEYRDENDVLYDKRTNFDTGEQTRLIFDLLEMENWDLINETRDAADRLTKKVTDFDNGNQRSTLFDVDDEFAWETYSRIFDSAGTLLSEEFT